MDNDHNLVSIVVPVYKVEKYLNKCIESILNQTYKYIEIILVDDGSPDSCPEICDYYDKKDKRIKVIHQENHGLAAARNVGMTYAKGKYITFIDSDDYVGIHYVESLYNAIVFSDADMSICDYIKVEDDCGKEAKNATYIVLDNVECLKDIYQPTWHGMEFVAWGKLYNIQLFKKNNICYPEGKIHEDAFVTYKLIYNAKKIVFTKEILYFYRQRENSIMTSHFSLKRLDKIEALRTACLYYEKGKEDVLLSMAANDYFQNCICIYGELEKYQSKLKTKIFEEKRLIKQYRKDIKTILLKVNLPIQKKIVYILFGLFPSKQWSKLIFSIKKRLYEK